MIRKLSIYYLIALIFWLWGIAVGLYKVFPYDQVKGLLDEIETAAKGHEETGPELDKELTAAISNKPVFHLRKRAPELEALAQGKRAFPPAHENDLLGVATSDGANAFLLYDSGDHLLHEWDLDYTRLFPDSEGDERMNLHAAMLLEDGSIIANFDEGGIVRMSWCGEVLWSFEDPVTHHQISRTDRNTIWVPGRQVLTSSLYGYPKGTWDDLLLELSIDTGEILRSISSVEILKRNQLHGQLEWVDSKTDFTHVNDIEELSPELAAAFPAFEAGDLAVNAKRINLLFVVDPETLKVKWHQQHPWNQPHDPDFMPDGRIRLFDNNQDRKGYRGWGQSRILLITPETGEVETLFEHPAFHSDAGSMVEGSLDDMLVISSHQSTLLNVRNGEIDFVFWRPYDDLNNYYIKHANWYPRSALPEDRQCH